MGEAPEIAVARSPTKALRLFDADRLRWLDEAAALGPVVAIRLGPVTLWAVSSAEAARTMLVTDGASWSRPPAVRSPIGVAVGENLFSQSDRAWARVQPLVAPSFRKKALDERLATMDAIVADEVASIPRGTDVDLELAMGRLSLRLAAWVLLGEELDAGRAEDIASHQREIVNWVGDQLGRMTGFLPFAAGKRAQHMKLHRAALHTYADEVIARATASDTDRDDVLGALLRARPGGRPLSPEMLRGHVLGLFLAGNETTAAALGWMLVNAARAPDAWADVRADPQRYGANFLAESLRITPAVWGIPRTPVKAGVTIKADDVEVRARRSQVATIYLRAIHRDPKTWPDPLRFDPSRFDDADTQQQRELLPFGLGPRGCIGQHLATAEMTAALPFLAQHGDVEVDGPVDEDAHFALRVRGGLRGRFVQPSRGSGASPLIP